jgi:hypothetical protein
MTIVGLPITDTMLLSAAAFRLNLMLSTTNLYGPTQFAFTFDTARENSAEICVAAQGTDQ